MDTVLDIVFCGRALYHVSVLRKSLTMDFLMDCASMYGVEHRFSPEYLRVIRRGEPTVIRMRTMPSLAWKQLMRVCLNKSVNYGLFFYCDLNRDENMGNTIADLFMNIQRYDSDPDWWGEYSDGSQPFALSSIQYNTKEPLSVYVRTMVIESKMTILEEQTVIPDRSEVEKSLSGDSEVILAPTGDLIDNSLMDRKTSGALPLVDTGNESVLSPSLDQAMNSAPEGQEFESMKCLGTEKVFTLETTEDLVVNSTTETRTFLSTEKESVLETTVGSDKDRRESETATLLCSQSGFSLNVDANEKELKTELSLDDRSSLDSERNTNETFTAYDKMIKMKKDDTVDESERGANLGGFADETSKGAKRDWPGGMNFVDSQKTPFSPDSSVQAADTENGYIKIKKHVLQQGPTEAEVLAAKKIISDSWVFCENKNRIRMKNLLIWADGFFTQMRSRLVAKIEETLSNSVNQENGLKLSILEYLAFETELFMYIEEKMSLKSLEDLSRADSVDRRNCH